MPSNGRPLEEEEEEEEDIVQALLKTQAVFVVSDTMVNSH
jgi:hypothetical protein